MNTDAVLFFDPQVHTFHGAQQPVFEEQPLKEEDGEDDENVSETNLQSEMTTNQVATQSNYG